ncbi:MAG: hypothetical protein LBU83_06085 [Bacteroidales bacterium]|jgi:hypothetical protein|nr:hypothetical protein [Bacteroidales bacterium]
MYNWGTLGNFIDYLNPPAQEEGLPWQERNLTDSAPAEAVEGFERFKELIKQQREIEKRDNVAID